MFLLYFLTFLLILTSIIIIFLTNTTNRHHSSTMPNQNLVLYSDGSFVVRDSTSTSSSSGDALGMFAVAANGLDDMTPPQPTQFLKSLPAAETKLLVPVQPPPSPPPQFSLQKWQAGQINVKQQPPAVQVPAWAFNPPPATWDERTAIVYTDKKPEWRILPSGSGTSPPPQGNGSRVVWKFG
jgi:hypothetical protein